MPAWPSTLPQIMRQGYSTKRGDGRIKTEMQGGHVRVRPGIKNVPRKYSYSCTFTPEQMVAFDAFWETTLKGGVLPIENVSVRINGAPKSVNLQIIELGDEKPHGAKHTMITFSAIEL